MLLGSPVSRTYVLYMFELGINLVELTLLQAGSRASVFTIPPISQSFKLTKTYYSSVQL